MILDENDNELLYWPVGALQAGQDSPAIVVKAQAFPGALLASNADANAKVMGRLHGVGSYQDLAVAPIDFGGMSGLVSFDIFIRPNMTIAGTIRVPFNVGAVAGTPAGWVL
jgi:hypothetical protein